MTVKTLDEWAKKSHRTSYTYCTSSEAQEINGCPSFMLYNCLQKKLNILKFDVHLL
jgi:hypothetical protein